MRINAYNLKFAWKHRRSLWRFRHVIRHRKAIAGWALTGAALAAGVLAARARAERGCAGDTGVMLSTKQTAS